MSRTDDLRGYRIDRTVDGTHILVAEYLGPKRWFRPREIIPVELGRSKIEGELHTVMEKHVLSRLPKKVIASEEYTPTGRRFSHSWC